MTAKGEFFPRRTNQYVPNMQYAADVRKGGTGKIRIPAMPALDADGILAAEDIAVAGSTTTFAATLTVAAMAKFGRNVTAVASGAATSTVTVHGHDYVGQPMTEVLTLNGTTPVLGKKAFKFIDKIEYGATAATTINVGWGNVLGLPYKLLKAYTELVDNVVATSAGTFVAGNNSAGTGTSADSRGTLAVHTNHAPDGSRYYDVEALFDESNLLGLPQYTSLT